MESMIEIDPFLILIKRYNILIKTTLPTSSDLVFNKIFLKGLEYGY